MLPLSLIKDVRLQYQGCIQEFVQGGGLIFFLSRGPAQHPLGHENFLKSIDFTGGGSAPIAPPTEYASVQYVFNIILISTLGTFEFYAEPDRSLAISLFSHWLNIGCSFNSSRDIE